MSVHPPHLLGSNTSAMIPFCAFGGDMNITGKYVRGLEYPVCNMFKPSIKDQQLCYTADLNPLVLQGEAEIRAGKGLGLQLIIDLGAPVLPQITPKEEELGNLFPTSEKVPENQFILKINTLGVYSNWREGMYKMSSLKLMTSTENFLALPNTTRKCQIEPQDDCLARRYVEEAQEQCHCVPWALGAAVQVVISS